MSELFVFAETSDMKLVTTRQPRQHPTVQLCCPVAGNDNMSLLLVTLAKDGRNGSNPFSINNKNKADRDLAYPLYMAGVAASDGATTLPRRRQRFYVPFARYTRKRWTERFESCMNIIRLKKEQGQALLLFSGSRGRIRTYECSSQSAVSYRLTTPQHFR